MLSIKRSFESTQLLTLETSRCPSYLLACCVLHNLFESRGEHFGLDNSDDEEMEAEAERADEEPAAPVDANSAARRDRIAEAVWQWRYG